MNEWIWTIDKHIESSDGFKFKRSGDSLIEPWKFDNITERKFVLQADTGDILLFKGSKAATAITRTVTWSDFDHVAMVMKFGGDPNEVYFIEAVGNSGVSLNRWSFTRKHVGPNKFYEFIVFRHIDFDRNNDKIKELSQYIA